jgi:hypothetical protein
VTPLCFTPPAKTPPAWIGDSQVLLHHWRGAADFVPDHRSPSWRGQFVDGFLDAICLGLSVRSHPSELWRILGDEADQAALCAGIGMTSMPSRNLTPAITFGNWFLPISRRQVFEAAITSLNTISRAVVEESEPLVRTVR